MSPPMELERLALWSRIGLSSERDADESVYDGDEDRVDPSST
jgi:hypothetical protein